MRTLAAALALAALTAAAAPARAEIGAYLVFDFATGKVLAAHRATTPWYPASITKLMTAYVTFKAIEAGALKMTSPVRISPQALQQPPSKMGFPLGTVITVETALRIILTKSANDVSVALAEAVGGTGAQFIARMNKAAADLGMGSTSFDNPHGLPNTKQVTTARDIAVLMRALADEFAHYSDYFEMGGVQLGKRTLRNHNRLIRNFRGADGMKTGFICASGFNLAASATRDGVRLGAVVLGGVTSRERDERTAELLAKGFEAAASGGRIRLNDFGQVDERLEVAAVAGEAEDLGTVEALPAASEPVVNITGTVCGARRPPTRYSQGVVTSREALEAQREAMMTWQAQADARESAREKALAVPRAVSPPAEATPAVVPVAGTPRALASTELRPASFDGSGAVIFPLAHPAREGPARVRRADFAPAGFVTSEARPRKHPLAGLRDPLPPRPTVQPLSYLEPTINRKSVPIRLGGADAARPDPLSGTVVGGGPPPRPRAKPLIEQAPPDLAFQPTPEDVTEIAAEVRDTVARPQ
ncbi:MAG: hypothetical protein AcusKO_16700 [Acuticoccus sp.]